MPDFFTDAAPLATFAELHRAIAARAPVKVRHYGGTQPGAVRELRPIAIVGRSLLAADMRGGRPILLHLSRIAVVHPSVPISYIPGFIGSREGLDRRRRMSHASIIAGASILSLMIIALFVGTFLVDR